MQDFDKLKDRFLSGVDPKKLGNLLGSDEVSKISKLVDPKAVEAAAKSGDTAALSDILAKVLATDEGKRLASKLGGEK